jgi:hypothetical protein
MSSAQQYCEEQDINSADLRKTIEELKSCEARDINAEGPEFQIDFISSVVCAEEIREEVRRLLNKLICKLKLNEAHNINAKGLADQINYALSYVGKDELLKRLYEIYLIKTSQQDEHGPSEGTQEFC